MRQETDPQSKARLNIDDEDRVRHISHLEQPWESAETSPLSAAVDYLRRETKLEVAPDELENPHQKVSFVDPRPQGIEFHFGGQKQLFDSSTIIFNETYLNVPVWRAAITLTLKHNPNRVLSVTDTSEREVNAPLPSAEKIDEHKRIFALAESERRLRVLGLESAVVPVGLSESEAETPTASFVRRVLGRETVSMSEDETAPADDARAIRGRFFVYRYDESKRVPPHPSASAAGDGMTEEEAEPAPAQGVESSNDLPVLSLPPVDESIKDGDWRVVSEITFTLTTPEFGTLNWRSLVDVETDSVLLLEPLVAGQFGFVFHRDPITSSGDPSNSPNRNNSVLNPLRNAVELPNLVAPADGVQSLRGRFVVVTDVNEPRIAPPTVAPGERFDYDVRTNNFAAVNAYYHADRFFALVESLGFPVEQYFDHTNFPVRIDHRDNFQTAGDTINAQCVGNGAGGIGFASYALNDLSNTSEPIGRACDSRVHLHELGGHGILYEHVDHANFGFAHSAGDSLSAILHDPESRAPDRFLYAPWRPGLDRRFDRNVAAGWAWGGSRDDKGYGSEQILCTTMFRVYQAVGGDSPDLNQRRFASRLVMYLILRAVSTLTPATNPRNALGFADALQAVDLLDWTTEGIFGGAYNKVIRWSFEKQGLYQAPGAAKPFTRAGEPPDVDVYIDDGRRGEYQFQLDFSQNPSVWNRRAADGGAAHQEPLAGVTNFAYVRVKNRGTKQAQNVRVRGFHHRPDGATVWPTDFQPLTTAELSVGTLAARSQEEKVVGPFAWVPSKDAVGRDSLLMVVSADGDPSNINHFSANESVAEWRLVPNDNNLGLRSVSPAATAENAESASEPSSLAEQLLRGLGLSGQRPKNVRVKSLTLQVDMEDDAAGSEVSLPVAASADVTASLTESAGEAAAEAEAEADWNMRRHAIIADAAWDRMKSEQARKEILRIFEESGGGASLGEAARWADQLKTSHPPNDPATQRFRGDHRNRQHFLWHYVDLPLGLDGYDRQHYPEFTRDDDVVQTILRCVESLRAPGPNARFEEVIALRLLTHLVGDLHQPVHVGCGYVAKARTNQARLVFKPEEALGLESDRGGGALLLPNGDNLHGFWDSSLGPNFIPDSLESSPDDLIVGGLRDADVPTPPALGEDEDIPARVVGWANESLKAARYAYPDTLRIVSYNPAPNGDEFYKVQWEGEDSYKQRCAPIVSERMAAAAANLAWLLDTIWP